MKRWKVLLSLCMSISIIGSLPAYGEIMVPPIPTAGNFGTTAGGESGAISSGPGANTGTPGSTTQNSSATTATLTQPEIQSQGAVLLDASTGKMLYGKNENTRYFPASITKLMTALLVLENANIDDTVTFSTTATTNLEAGSVSLNIVAGDQLTVSQSLYAILLKSANEVANGLAEYISGSIGSFADKMNARAKALGCTNTNFVNPHGLNNSNHYTTPYDMALIAREAFKNQTLCTIANTVSYTFPATQKVAQTRTLTMGHKMINPNDSKYYPGIVGGKTGYTSLAGNTLVTCVEKNGVRLIAVIMKSKSTHYDDTKALLDYGFNNYLALSAGGGAAGVSKWEKDSNGWYFIKADGNKAKNEWMTIDQKDYWFDSNTYMATGWRQFSNGAWYFFKPTGVMATNYWIQNEGKWFYMGSDGAMLKNTTTPDGYRVNENGVWENAG